MALGATGLVGGVWGLGGGGVVHGAVRVALVRSPQALRTRSCFHGRRGPVARGQVKSLIIGLLSGLRGRLLDPAGPGSHGMALALATSIEAKVSASPGVVAASAQVQVREQ